jgi:hypothetical protein
MYKKIIKIYIICILFLSVFIYLPLKNKISSETNHNIALAVKYDDIVNLFGKEKITDFKNSGINAVVISDEKAKDFFLETRNDKYLNYPQEKYIGFASEKISNISKLNLDIILWVQGNISLLPKKIPRNMLSVILSDDFYGEIPESSNYTFGLLEFFKQKDAKKIIESSQSGFRVFKLRWDFDYKKNIERIKRAAIERNTKIIILDISQTNIESALEYVKQSKTCLEEAGFVVKRPIATENINSLLVKLSILTKGLSFLLAIVSPVFCLILIQMNFNFLQKHFSLKIFTIFLMITISSLLSGTIISGLLSTKDFMLGVDLFRGIKLALILPVVFSILILYKENIQNFLKKPVLFGELLFLGIIVVILGLYILRSGNSGIMSSIEEVFRLYLEKLLIIRPRLKEFMIGHPFMLLAIYLKFKEDNLWKPLFIIGLIGQISIINTFCHIHTPFFVSLLRTLTGIGVGTIFGIILIYLYKKLCLK